MYEQAAIPVDNEPVFGALKQSIDNAFCSVQVGEFLRSLQRKQIRIRHFEDVLASGLLGPNAAKQYSELGNGDQGMIREHYLSTLEKVDPELRQRFFKVYAYY